MIRVFSKCAEVDQQGKGHRSFASAVGKKGTSRPRAETPRRGDEHDVTVPHHQDREAVQKLLFLLSWTVT